MGFGDKGFEFEEVSTAAEFDAVVLRTGANIIVGSCFPFLLEDTCMTRGHIIV